MASVCRDCREELEHCHGTVIVHALSAVECTEDCATPEAVHPFRIDCVSTGCACSVAISVWVAS